MVALSFEGCCQKATLSVNAVFCYDLPYFAKVLQKHFETHLGES
jgi:hypothetical protein